MKLNNTKFTKAFLIIIIMMNVSCLDTNKIECLKIIDKFPKYTCFDGNPLPKIATSNSMKFLVKSKENNKLFILKKMPIDYWNKAIQELRTLKTLKENCKTGGTVMLIDYLEEEDYVYEILEFGKKGSLENYIKQKGFEDKKDLLIMFRSIARAVMNLHDLGFVHGDINCSNIVLINKQTPLLVDFEGTKEEGEKNYSSANYYYTSPEVTDTFDVMTTVRKENDIYSLGVVLYYMMTKKFPFRASKLKDMATIKKHGIYPVFAGMNIQMVELINMMINPNKEKRASIEDIYNKVEYLIEKGSEEKLTHGYYTNVNFEYIGGIKFLESGKTKKNLLKFFFSLVVSVLLIRLYGDDKTKEELDDNATGVEEDLN